MHLNIERRLIDIVGSAGKRLHTARSRNDQVATDLRLWLRDAIDEIARSHCAWCSAPSSIRRTSTRQPSCRASRTCRSRSRSPSGTTCWRTSRCSSATARVWPIAAKRVNRLPLGAAALAGTSFPIDRARVARELGFEGLSENSLDAVSDRDFAIEFCACAALAMVHFSRLSEELILWTSPRFGFVTPARPRSAPARRSCRRRRIPMSPSWRAARPGGSRATWSRCSPLMKGQPLAYNKDNQEDKEPLFDAVDTCAIRSRFSRK